MRKLALHVLRAVAVGFVLAFAVAGHAADQRELTIVTSFPPSVFVPFQQAFEAENNDIRVKIIQRNTASASRFITENGDVPVDMFWASAADAFELLKRRGLLQQVASRNTGAPEMVFGYPVNDPDGYYLGFALSGYGFVYNPSYLSQNGLTPPRDWEQLLDPTYSGHIGITPPSRSGTTHLMIEALLQTHGWDKGWAMLSQLGGNLSTVTARSFGVASGVAQRRFGIGITIDFLAQAPGADAGQTIFVMPPDTVFVPASIAILKRAHNVAAAERFIDFLLSDEGQHILLRPSIGRIPILPHLSRGMLPAGGQGLLGRSSFDAGLSASRYGLVNVIFDEYVVRRRAMLARLWKRLAELETQKGQSPETLSLLARARHLLQSPPVTQTEMDRLDNSLKADRPRRTERTLQQADFIARLRATVESDLNMADALLTRASGPASAIGER